MKILVVDDERVVVEHIKNVLTKKGDEIDTALSGEEALSLLKDFKYDVAFIDYQLPGKSGLEIVGFIKKRSPETKVAMLTGYPLMKESIAKFVGVDEYMEKPLDIEEIQAVVEKYRPKTHS